MSPAPSPQADANPMPLVKCCGMFRQRDIEAVNAARPDFCGFVIDFPKSHRNVTPGKARALRLQLDPGIKAVGVFVDRDAERVAEIANSCALHAVQLHGQENEEYIETLRQLTDAFVIKAFRVRSASDLEAALASSADFVLLDNGQGTGEAFDWNLLKGFGRPYFLAGGLTPASIPEAVRRLRPYAIDMSSGLETNGKKDAEKIAQAVAAARKRAI